MTKNLIANEVQTDGIFDGISFKEYRLIDAANKSTLDLIEKSPAHAKHEKENPSEPTKAMVFGSMFHDALLLPTEFDKRYVVAPTFDKRTTAGKTAVVEFARLHEGKAWVDEDDKKQMDGMIESIRSSQEASKYVYNGTSELSCFWKDELTGLLCKARPDLLLDSGIIVDIKTTDDASFKGFQKSIVNFRYHVQAAFYIDGLSQHHRCDSFVIIAVEKKPPYAVAVYALDEATIDKGRELYRANLETYAECKKSGIWPAYPDETQTMNLPSWGW